MTRWLAPLPTTPTPDQVLIRWCTSLARLTRWPHPWRPWLLRRIAELRTAAIEIRRMRRTIDEVARDAQTDAQCAETLARIRREWAQLEKHT